MDDLRVEQNRRGHVGQRAEEGNEQRFLHAAELALRNDQLGALAVPRSLFIGDTGRCAISHRDVLLEAHKAEQKIDLLTGLFHGPIAAGGAEVGRNQTANVQRW